MKTKEADYALERIHNLMQVVPEIWFTKKDNNSLKRNPSDLNLTLNPTHVVA